MNKLYVSEVLKTIDQLKPSDYRPNELVDYLNKVFRAKISGKPFDYTDVNQYSIRGYLPKSYGGQKITKKIVRRTVYLIIHKKE